MDRRSFLIGTLVGAGACLAGPRALADATVYHVLYPGSTTEGQAAELLAQVAALLGDGVAARLKIVEYEGRAVVIFDRSGWSSSGDRLAAAAVAQRHDELLRAVADEDRVFATVVGSTVVDATWNIRYGAPGTEEAMRRVFTTVTRILGSGVAKDLVIESSPSGVWQVVYQRRGDATSTAQVANHHARLLRSSGLDAVAVTDAFGTLLLNASTAAEAVLDLPAADALPADHVAAEAPVERAPSGLPHLGVDDDPVPVEPSPEDEDDTAHDAPAAATGPGPHPPPACYDDSPSLQSAINVHVQTLRAQGRVSASERTSWLVHDLVADHTLCAINASVPLQAASMIKPFVAIAFFDLVERGKLGYGDQSREHMEKMIRDSSNSSTNWLLERVGGPAACQGLLKRRFPTLCSGVSIVEYIPSSGCTYRNLAAAWDYGRLLMAMWNDEVPSARELRRLMNLPGRDRLYSDVPEIPSGVEVYNKTGTTAMCCGDMGILVARTRDGHRVPYLVVGVIERDSRTSRYTSWSQSRSDVIRSVSGLTYRYLSDRYDLA